MKALPRPIALIGAALVVMCAPMVSSALTMEAARASFDRAVLHAANQLDDAASLARRAPRKALTVPSVRILQSTTTAHARTTSLDMWLQIELGRIRKEKSRTDQARDLASLAASLRLLAQPVRAATPAIDPRSQAGAIVAQPAYRTGGAGPAPPPHESLIQRVLRWLKERIDELIVRIVGATASKPIIGQVVTVLYLALLAALVVYLAYVIVRVLVRRRRKAAAPDEGTPLPEQLDPDGLYQSGTAAAAAGHYAHAVSLLFQASLASFDRAGKLAYDRSLTAGEYRRAVRSTLAAASPHFDDIARAFVFAAFAERPISKDDFATVDAAYQSLRPLLAA